MDVDLEQLRAYAEYLRDLGVHDLYRSQSPLDPAGVEQLRSMLAAASLVPASRPAAPVLPSPERGRLSPALAAAKLPPAVPIQPQRIGPAIAPSVPVPLETSIPKPVPFDDLAPLPAVRVAAADRAAALTLLQAEIGDCTRCPLAYAGRHTVVFGEGDPTARLMFVGEGPGADEDASGRPFIGKAGQLLNNMITAMGLKREEVYIANIVKCRPPANRVPEPVEANTCAQFLLRQIDTVQPQVIVALGATAALYLLGVKQSLASLRGSFHSCRGAKLAVTYHPAFLLRDPRQKGEAWKDLQRVMVELGLQAPAKA